MAQKPRTPVHFPRMKVRGHRNRAKSAARHKHRTLIPHATMTQTAPGSYQFAAIAGWEPGCWRIQIDRIADGWGRQIGRPQTRVEPAPEPRPDPSFSMQFKVENRMSDDLWEKLFGEARDGT